MRNACGFARSLTMIVMAIVLVLISIAVPRSQKALLRARESVLKNDLFTMRTGIHEYSYDKQTGPRNLQDLVNQGYMKEVPVDPFTNSNRTWKLVMEKPIEGVSPTAPEVFDVKSGSDAKSLKGKPYSEW